MARIVALLVVAVIAAVPATALAAAATNPTQTPFQQQAPAPTQNQVGEVPAQTQAPAQQTSSDNGAIKRLGGTVDRGRHRRLDRWHLARHSARCEARHGRAGA